LQAAYPRFVDGTEIDKSGLVAEINRREALARLIVESDYLSQAIVNRLWEHFFGYGFTRPVDDMGPHNPPSHPELLQRLAGEFSARGHNLKELIRWITLSEAYSLSSRFGGKLGNGADDPSRGTPPLFSHFYLRQMSPEQLYDSLLVAIEARDTYDNYAEFEAAKRDWLQQFMLVFGTDENDEATTFNGTVAQALMMMNGDLIRHATSVQAGSFLHQVAKRGGRGTEQINHLFSAALARNPSRGELDWANNLLTSRNGNTSTVLEDIWWALLNSNEFILNH
jgi:hypothetical protein